jgi:hypothetical protein
MDRDRMGAWVDSLGPHPHVPYFRQLLAAYDDKAAAAERFKTHVAAQAEARLTAEARLAVVEADANRLAEWIIRHPSPHDPSEVLALHDRL